MKLRFTYSLVLLCAPLAASLSVPFYNRTTPTLGGWPFFYWWQTACILASALLTGAVCLLEERSARHAASDDSQSSGRHA